MSNKFRIRRAIIKDADIIAWHRARMFQDMGELSGDAFELLRAKSRVPLMKWLESGDYIGWLASCADRPESVIAGAGVQVYSALPRPVRRGRIGDGRQGIIINVFSEPEWRGKGIATMLMKEIINWAKSENLDRLSLHASDEGRAVYERLGFISSNEMRFPG
jgi:GNAT superfamily N-acetyltransferase